MAPSSIACWKSPASSRAWSLLSTTMAVQAANGGHVQLGLAEEVRADGVEVRALADPGSAQHRLAAGRGRDDDVLVLGRLLGTVDGYDLGLTRRTHFRGETATILFIAAVHGDPSHLAHGADGEQLRAGLIAAAEETDLRGVGSSQVLRGDATRGTGPHLAEIVGLHQTQQGAGLAVVEDEVELGRRLAAGGVNLRSHDAERLGGRRHRMKNRVIGLDACPRHVESLIEAHLPQPQLDGLEGHVHGQQAADVIFVQE
jgi:hypothetical protein